MTLKDEKQFFLDCCGEDNDGNSKAIISVKMSVIDITNQDKPETVIGDVILDKPVLNICRSVEYTILDITFQNPTDYEFANLIGKLQNFCSAHNSMTETTVAEVIVTIASKEHKANYMSVGTHGFWCIQPSRIGAANDTLRFVFSNDYFDTKNAEEGAFDIETIE